MSKLFRQSVGLILMLVFAGVGALSTFAEPVVVESTGELSIIADAPSCCSDASPETCSCCDEEASCCSENDTHECGQCSCARTAGSLSPMTMEEHGEIFELDTHLLTDFASNGPVEGTPKPIEHIPIRSIS